jgi:sugar phosphate isomerase/epimerase
MLYPADVEAPGVGASRGSLLSLAHLTSVSASPLELVEAAADAGFDAVSLRLSPGDLPAGTVPTADILRQTKDRLNDLGLRVLDVEIARLRPEFGLDGLERLLEAGAGLEASFLLVIGDHPDEGWLADRLAELERRAATYAVKPVLEFMPFSHVKSLDQARRIVARAAIAKPCLLVDSLHLFRSGGSAADLAALDPDLVAFAHLADGPAQSPKDLRYEGRSDRGLPGDGELPLTEFLRALPPGLPIEVEVPGPGTLRDRARAAAQASRRLIRGSGGGSRPGC